MGNNVTKSTACVMQPSCTWKAKPLEPEHSWIKHDLPSRCVCGAEWKTQKAWLAWASSISFDKLCCGGADSKLANSLGIASTSASTCLQWQAIVWWWKQIQTVFVVQVVRMQKAYKCEQHLLWTWEFTCDAEWKVAKGLEAWAHPLQAWLQWQAVQRLGSSSSGGHPGVQICDQVQHFGIARLGRVPLLAGMSQAIFFACMCAQRQSWVMSSNVNTAMFCLRFWMSFMYDLDKQLWAIANLPSWPLKSQSC